MCKTLLLIFFVNVFVLNCRAGMNTENPYIDPANPSFTSITFPDGTVQISSPTAGGGGGSGSDETALIRSTYNATGKSR